MVLKEAGSASGSATNKNVSGSEAQKKRIRIRGPEVTDPENELKLNQIAKVEIPTVKFYLQFLNHLPCLP